MHACLWNSYALGLNKTAFSTSKSNYYLWYGWWWHPSRFIIHCITFHLCFWLKIRIRRIGNFLDDLRAPYNNVQQRATSRHNMFESCFAKMYGKVPSDNWSMLYARMILRNHCDSYYLILSLRANSYINDQYKTFNASFLKTSISDLTQCCTETFNCVFSVIILVTPNRGTCIGNFG